MLCCDHHLLSKVCGADRDGKEKTMLQSKSNAMRAISIALTVIVLLVAVLASTESVSAATKLKVTVTKKTIYVGQTTKFKSNKDVKWSVSSKSKAKLSSIKKRSVTVKGLKAGKVTVTAKRGKVTRKTTITIKPVPTKIRIYATKKVIGLGEYCSVIVKSVEPAGVSESVTYSSSNTKIATVDRDGLVQGMSPGTATITVASKVKSSVKATVKIRVVPTRAGTVTLTADLSDETRYPAGKVAKVWLPVPQSDDHQSIKSVKCDAPEAAVKKLTKDSAGGKQYYVEWDEDTPPEDRVATLTYHLYRRAVERGESIESVKSTVEDVDQEEFEVYLKETYWSGDLDSGIVKDTADDIVERAGAETVYEMAHAIYNEMCDKYVRTDDKTVIFGDVVSILKGVRGEEGGRNAGSCMDMNSVFVALCRSEGIPARNLFGLRFWNEDANGNQKPPSPNCRAEFYLPGYGWVPADPALAIKQYRGLDGDPVTEYDPTWEKVKSKFWGNGEENWICVNMGRDIVLDPPQSVATEEYLEVLNPVNDEGVSTINLYMFPYGEFDGQYIPCQASKNFKYEYSFEKEDPLDCGC